MRFPVPERFSYKQVGLFAASLFTVEILEGTDLTFAVLVFAYVCIFAAAFNIAGGLSYPSGAWIFFTGTLTCIGALTYKALLNEPGDVNLHAPVTTMAAYCLAMSGMAAAAFLCRSIRPKRGLLAEMAVGEKMKQAAIGCLVFGVATGVASASAHHESATLSSAFAQLNRFVQMAIILATTYQIATSKGKSSTNWIVWSGGLFLLVTGLVNFSKEAMFSAPVTWLLPCIAMRFNFSRKQIIVVSLAVLFMIFYLVPLSQFGRRSRDLNGDQRIQAAAAWDYILHIRQTRQAYLESQEVANVGDNPHLFNESQGIFDRLQMLALDDALIDYTDHTEQIGLWPTANSFLNIVPRSIWQQKPIYADGNRYGRELGVLSSEDTSTGISFSAVSDAYHQAGWFGIGFVLPTIMLLLFLISDSLAGDVRQSPWGLLFIAMAAHLAPEGLLSGAVWTASFGAETVILTALLTTYVLPRIITLATGGERTRFRFTRPFPLGRIPNGRVGSMSEPTNL